VVLLSHLTLFTVKEDETKKLQIVPPRTALLLLLTTRKQDVPQAHAKRKFDANMIEADEPGGH
jgi:hypothetical protein